MSSWCECRRRRDVERRRAKRDLAHGDDVADRQHGQHEVRARTNRLVELAGAQQDGLRAHRHRHHEGAEQPGDDRGHAAGDDGRAQGQADVDEERGDDGDDAAEDEVDARPAGAVGQHDVTTTSSRASASGAGGRSTRSPAAGSCSSSSVASHARRATCTTTSRGLDGPLRPREPARIAAGTGATEDWWRVASGESRVQTGRSRPRPTISHPNPSSPRRLNGSQRVNREPRPCRRSRSRRRPSRRAMRRAIESPSPAPGLSTFAEARELAEDLLALVARDARAVVRDVDREARLTVGAAPRAARC